MRYVYGFPSLIPMGILLFLIVPGPVDSVPYNSHYRKPDLLASATA